MTKSLDEESGLSGLSTGSAPLSSSASTPDDELRNEIMRLAAPLSKEQLIEILISASSVSPFVQNLIYQASISSPASRRLMVRNIHYSTNDDVFANHFSKFGRLEDAAIVRERSGRSKGFGFVTFADISAMQRCLDSPLHLDGRKLFVKVAADPFSEFVVDGMPVQGRCSRRKIFVRNLNQQCDADALRSYFSKYGPIEDCSVVYNSNGISKGFAFITFAKQDSAVRAAAEPQQTLMGRVIFVSMAKSANNEGPRPFTPAKGPKRAEGTTASTRFEELLEEAFQLDSPLSESLDDFKLSTSWQPFTPATADDWDLTRHFTEYAYCLKDAVF